MTRHMNTCFSVARDRKIENKWRDELALDGENRRQGQVKVLQSREAGKWHSKESEGGGDSVNKVKLESAVRP